MSLSPKRPSKKSSKREDISAKIMADVTDKVSKPKRLNVIVEEDLLKRMKAHALKEGRNVSDITRDLWLDHMSK